MSVVTVLRGDCRDVLRGLPSGSVNCCVTSPPYWGLRDYGTGDSQIGLEDELDAYVSELVGVFREVRRVLRDDGTLWLNLGDSFASAWPCRRRNEIGAGSLPDGTRTARAERMSPGLKEKDLCGVPWRVAFALQADGWWLRSDIIWNKPNPMPESVTDRPTKAHEYIFLLAKSQRYYYDAEAIAEEGICPAGTKAAKGSEARATHVGVNSRPTEYKIYDGRRNKRDVWTVATQPYPEAHFATYPPALIEPCILAGSTVGGVVLDPFAGSGTTLDVAATHGRDSIGIELSEEYVGLIRGRLAKNVFAVVEVRDERYDRGSA